MSMVQLYRGKTLEEINRMSMNELMKLLPARIRRSLRRGLHPETRKLFEKIRRVKAEMAKGGTQPKRIRTHRRDLPILPEMIGLTIEVHNGKDFLPVEITLDKVGRYLGEFVITNKRVVHGKPGVGASKSSTYVPLK
ncbi:MAG: 30S ribosomal protein S19 [Thermoproteota archaeon]